MKSKISVGVKASVVYTIAILFSKGLSFITVPIFTRLMPTEQIGIVNLYNSWFAMISSIATLSLTSGGFQVALKEYEDRRDEYVSSVLSLTMFLALIFGGMYFFSPKSIEKMIGLDRDFIIMILGGLLVTPATEFWLSRNRYEYKYIKAAILTMSSAFFASLISVIFVILANENGIKELAKVRLVANNFVIYFVAFLLCISIFLKGKTFYNKKFWRFSLSLSIPLVGNSFAVQLLNLADRSMISRLNGNSAVGIYSTLSTVSALSSIVWGAINSSFVPFLFSNYEKKSKRKDIKKVANLILLLYAIVAIGLTIIAPEIVKILATKEYYDAIYIMPPIAAGIFMMSVSALYSNILIMLKKTQYIMISSFAAATVNIILNYFCIKQWGYMAAAYTTLVAYVVMAGMQFVVSKHICTKNYMVDEEIYNNKIIWLIAVLTICMCLLCVFLYNNLFVRYFVIVVICLVVFIFRKQIMTIIKKDGKERSNTI